MDVPATIPPSDIAPRSAGTLPDWKPKALPVKPDHTHYTIILKSVNRYGPGREHNRLARPTETDPVAQEEAQVGIRLFIKEVMTDRSAEPGLARLQAVIPEFLSAIESINDPKVRSKVGKWIWAHGATLLSSCPWARPNQIYTLPLTQDRL